MLAIINKKIKSCPCCGSEARLIKNRKPLDEEEDYDSCKVMCIYCGIQTDSYVNNEEMPIRTWNNRYKNNDVEKE